MKTTKKEKKVNQSPQDKQKKIKKSSLKKHKSHKADSQQTPPQKIKKAVQFNLNENKQYEIESKNLKSINLLQQSQSRKWNQKIYTEIPKTGKFTDEEAQILKQALCKYAYEKNLDEKSLLKLVSAEKPQKETLGAWSQIAECLPYRSVQSCHDFCRRRFNPNNYGGNWNECETQQLIKLVEIHGRKWKFIGEQLERTELNVRDKYKEIGEDNHSQRKKGFWKIQELVLLLKKIQKLSGIKILKKRKKLRNEIEKNAEKLNEESLKQYNKNKRKRDILDLDANTTFLLAFINYPGVQELQNQGSIQWTQIAEKLQTKSKDDCRNKWVQLQRYIFFYGKNFTSESDEDLVSQIIEQDVESEGEIDFDKIFNNKSTQENKERWNIIKKRGDFKKEFHNELLQIKKSFEKNQQDGASLLKKIKTQQNGIQNELVEFFKNNYLQKS
ncbi:ttf1 protein, putative [Ichthyophthirius multifiliis]|uniref:Ttf1 protein, putative n=1 Tax=Ichthyophthirius multifiliis TaxID=5932 RepID=G0R156_ICHMU|nr:ttf1 protein, putative [Ichthyophthirius multifiliis]EGR28823.1 ttf1 protein, putative [Ichthyophthirius multifiliis]|eukprot:XP_004030059.1 ttf1 protein, putative [Ichthyophthirius multifiliis]